MLSTMDVYPAGLLPTLILLLCILPIPIPTVAEGTCEFPEFLQSAEEEGELKPWSTRLWWLHLRHRPKWAEKQEVYVKGSNMWRHRDHNLKDCANERSPRKVYKASSLGRCSERQLVHNRTCIAIQGYSKYRVIQYNADRTHRFTCMRFVRRSENVVQVYEGHLSESNDDDLCDDDNLVLDEWPWVAASQKRPYFCPVSGGFTFRTIRRLTNEDFCEEEWRRSHLEIECVRGDGLHFMAPAGSNCNPFVKEGDFKSLTCWAGWEEGEYIFLVAADRNEPRYCLRFPKLQNGEFSVLVYFSIICPTENDGKPHPGIEYYELRMRRKDLFQCEDENRLHCKHVADSGICTEEHDYAKHCPRSCKVCGHHEAEERYSCHFSMKIVGEWTLYERDRTEEVIIDRDTLSFSLLGDFRCAETLNEDNYLYKTVSKFRNGCSERYTCFQFDRRNNNLLQYRVGHSFRRDSESDRLCDFHEDSYPLMDDYRSYYFKNLILANNLWPSYCGLNSNIPFNGSLAGEVCEGQVGDWDPDTCTTRGTIMFTSSTCTSLIIPKEYQCLAYIPAEDKSLQQLLITRSMDGLNEYNCWIISSYVEGGRWPYRIMYQMPNTQCSLMTEIEIGTTITSKATLYLNDRARNKVCRMDHETHTTASTHDSLTKSTDLKYVILEQNNGHGSEHVQMGSQRPQADGSSPTPPSEAAQANGSGYRPSLEMFTLFLAVLVSSSSTSLSSTPSLSLLLLSSGSVWLASLR